MRPRWTSATTSSSLSSDDARATERLYYNLRVSMTRAARPDRLGLAAPLLRWYDRTRRDLPWRRETSPYRTLVSEYMAQQTVLATVLPYFERFLSRFPD